MSNKDTLESIKSSLDRRYKIQGYLTYGDISMDTLGINEMNLNRTDEDFWKLVCGDSSIWSKHLESEKLYHETKRDIYDKLKDSVVLPEPKFGDPKAIHNAFQCVVGELCFRCREESNIVTAISSVLDSH